jgi:hypothetical protein
MADHQAGQERLLKQLISTFRCQFCRQSFEREKIRVTARHEKLWIVGVRCTRCGKQQVFWIALKEEGQLGMLSDLTDVEETHFASMPAISSDDVLDMHEFLSAFDGDFHRLFTGA